MIIQVTREHIGHGIPNSGDSCPISLALKEMGYCNAVVTDDNINFFPSEGKNNELKYRNLPYEAADFVANFDQGKVDLEPFTFEIANL